MIYEKIKILQGLKIIKEKGIIHPSYKYNGDKSVENKINEGLVDIRERNIKYSKLLKEIEYV